MATDDLGIAERLRRKMGRPARTQSVATRFTKEEELELLKAAEKEGKTLREWTREALYDRSGACPGEAGKYPPPRRLSSGAVEENGEYLSGT